MQLTIPNASLILLFCTALSANAAPLPTSNFADLAVRVPQNANPATNNGGRNGAGAAAGVSSVIMPKLSKQTNISQAAAAGNRNGAGATQAPAAPVSSEHSFHRPHLISIGCTGKQ